MSLLHATLDGGPYGVFLIGAFVAKPEPNDVIDESFFSVRLS